MLRRFSSSSTATLVGTLDFGAVITDGGGIPQFTGSSSQVVIPDPATLGDRVAQVADCFAEWRVNRFQLRYVSSSSSATGGLLALGCVDDAAQAVTLTAPTIAQVNAMKGSVENGVWKNFAFVWGNPAKRFQYTSAQAKDTVDLRWAAPLSIYVAGFGLAATTTYGRFELDYHLSFRGAKPVTTVNATIRTGQAVQVAAPSEKTLGDYVKLDYVPEGTEKRQDSAIGNATPRVINAPIQGQLLAVSAAELDMLRARRQVVQLH